MVPGSRARLGNSVHVRVCMSMCMSQLQFGAHFEPLAAWHLSTCTHAFRRISALQVSEVVMLNPAAEPPRTSAEVLAHPRGKKIPFFLRVGDTNLGESPTGIGGHGSQSACGLRLVREIPFMMLFPPGCAARLAELLFLEEVARLACCVHCETLSDLGRSIRQRYAHVSCAS